MVLFIKVIGPDLKFYYITLTTFSAIFLIFELLVFEIKYISRYRTFLPTTY